MPELFLRFVSAEFESRGDGADYDRPEDALAIGLHSATIVGADEIHAGRKDVAIEVIVENGDGVAILRSMVHISVSALSAQSIGDAKH